jgi:TetR/AcrR family transcriptional repressor of nem operon
MGRTSNARENLIQATIDLIWVHSYGAVSVDAICERAGAKKGSFYHFFRSKDDLVLAALRAHWEERRATLDRLFSPTVAPLDRLRGYFDSVYHRQRQQQKRYGFVVGCFYNNVGTECAENNPEIAATVKAILSNYERYYESALTEAQARGDIRITDIPGKCRTLFAFMEGMLGQARIRNDVEVLRNLQSSAMQILGIEAPRGSGRPPRRAAAG